METALVETTLVETALMETALVETALVETTLVETGLVETMLVKTASVETVLCVDYVYSVNVNTTPYELLTLTDKSQPIGKCAVLVTQCSFGCHLSHFHYYCLEDEMLCNWQRNTKKCIR